MSNYHADGNWKEHTGSRRVMVVDDNDAIRTVIESILDDMGLPVVSLAGGREAVDYYRGHHDGVMLTLLDWKMPDMDGHETFYAMHSIRTDSKIIVVSGFIEPDIVEALYKAGLTGFLRKPFEVDDLICAVRGALRMPAPDGSEAKTR